MKPITAETLTLNVLDEFAPAPSGGKFRKGVSTWQFANGLTVTLTAKPDSAWTRIDLALNGETDALQCLTHVFERWYADSYMASLKARLYTLHSQPIAR